MKSIESRYRIISELLIDGRERFIPQEKSLFSWRCFYANQRVIDFISFHDKSMVYDPIEEAKKYLKKIIKNPKPRIFFRSKGEWFEKL